eukprot:gene3143-1447_t
MTKALARQNAEIALECIVVEAGETLFTEQATFHVKDDEFGLKRCKDSEEKVEKLTVLFYLPLLAQSTILRLPCQTFAEFTVFHMGKALKGHVIKTERDVDDIGCTRKCVEHHKCRSYNLNVQTKECQLNERRHGENGTQLVDAPGWLYKSTDYSKKLIGATCRALNPCPSHILCRDKCTSPFYECVYCDANHRGLHCDISLDKNDCEKNPCQNGKCVDEHASYFCICDPGFTGRNCESDINECESLPCFNGGTCRNDVNRFQCNCLAGYSGTHCEEVLDYVGCYIDSQTRALPLAKRLDISAGHLTANCIKACFASNQPYAGLQYFYHCFCGPSYDIHGKGDESTCSTKCQDSTGMYCGGSWRNSVYRTGESTSQTSDFRRNLKRVSPMELINNLKYYFRSFNWFFLSCRLQFT